MSALRILVPVKRVIDYAVSIPCRSRAEFISTNFRDHVSDLKLMIAMAHTTRSNHV